jgi:hypothetical protein
VTVSVVTSRYVWTLLNSPIQFPLCTLPVPIVDHLHEPQDQLLLL